MKTTDKLLNTICLDERIQDGTFTMENDGHMDILQEYLEKYGLTKEEAEGVRNKMLEGRFPERQAYNKNGLLVTFPTPEYKARAIKRGTHFEQNPTKKAPNISFAGQQPPAQAAPAAAQAAPAAPETPAAPTAPEAPAEPKAETPVKSSGGEPSKLEPADSSPPQSSPQSKESDQNNPPNGKIQTPSTPAPQTPPAMNPLPTEPQAGAPAVQAVPQAPVVPEKTPEQKKAEEQYSEMLLKTEEITLEEGKNVGLKCTLNNLWYNKDGYIVGKTIYSEAKNRQLIRLLKND